MQPNPNPNTIQMDRYYRPNTDTNLHPQPPIDDMKPHLPPDQQSPAMLCRSSSVQSLNKNQLNNRQAPQQGYCKKLCGYWRDNRLFFFYQIISGNMLKHFFKKIGLGCLAGDSIIETMIEWIQRVITPRWLPLVLRPFLTGAFLPLILFFWLDYRYLKDQSKDSSPLSDLEQNMMVVSYFITLCLFILVGVKDSGSFDQPSMRLRSDQIIASKPYLRGSEHYCSDCDMIKPIRAQHCHRCGICVSKYSKHSILLNKCIGAGNELMYLLMITAVLWTISVVLDVFVFQPLKGWVMFKIAFYFLNAHLQLQCAADALEGLLCNTVYNGTRYEILHWESLEYLNSEKGFQNVNDLGLCSNIGEVLLNMTCGGRFQPHQLNFLQLAKEPIPHKRIKVNWTYSLMFHPAQLPNNPNKAILAEAAYISESNLMGQTQSKLKEQAKHYRNKRPLSERPDRNRQLQQIPKTYQSASVNTNKMEDDVPNHQKIEDEHD